MEDIKFQNALSKAVPINGWLKRLLAHELALYNSGELQNITHHGSSSMWLETPSSSPPPGRTNVYRPMGDIEILYLIEHRQLPDTQPYQAIIEGENGRLYANKYLTGAKWTSTSPTTIVEFCAPIELIETLKQKQMKVEDGALSMGLGDKAGKGLPIFNESIRNGDTTFRIVKIKRNKEKQDK
ncbi:unnamed protein product [Adineta steineri]|uniref:Uncharacterized protein n=1 Tax=Adineta steineri TaxID=433720 RepID=A0A818WH84_9BILA|nr:unnamed protein product [Adineta steineri]